MGILDERKGDMAPNTLESLEASQETKYALDEEHKFRLNAQAVALFGQWVAGQLARGESYVAALSADFSAHGLQHVMEKVLSDFRAAGIETTEHHLENQFALHVSEAAKSLSA